MKSCPACNRQVQEMELECPYCGVIFAKWTPRQEIFPQKSVVPKDDGDRTARYKWIIYIGLALEILTYAFVFVPIQVRPAGMLLSFIGIYGYAKMQGHSGDWALLVFIPVFGPIIGLIVLRRPLIEGSSPILQTRTRILISFGVFVFVTASALFGLKIVSDESSIHEVHDNIPNLFPILIVTPDEKNREYHAQVVNKMDLDQFEKNNPNYSFLVPEGQKENLQNQLESERLGEPQRGTYFKHERLSNGRQSFEVGESLDYGENFVTGWYEATEKEIYPKRRRLTGLYGQFMVLGMPSFALGVICSYLTFMFLKMKRRG